LLLFGSEIKTYVFDTITSAEFYSEEKMSEKYLFGGLFTWKKKSRGNLMG